jgi:hypothetical protein
MKQTCHRDMFQKAAKSICTSTLVALPDSLSPVPPIFLDMKTPENTDEESDDTQPAYEGDIQMKYSSD